MSARLEGTGDGRPAGFAAEQARSLLLPAVIALVLIATIYIPTHPSGSAGQALLAAIAGTYVVGMAVLMPRVTRVLILAGRRAVGDAPFLRPNQVAAGAPPARRLAAVAVGAVVSGALAAVAAAATTGAAPGSYQHAIGSLAVLANFGLLLATLVPVPGLAGWDAVEAVADLRCSDPDHRAAHVARTAKAASAVLAILLTAASLRIGDPMLPALGALMAVTVWVQAEALRRLDVVSRFFAGHTADDLARPVNAVLRVDDRVADLTSEARAHPALVLDGAGLFAGAIGPRQMLAAASRPAARCGDAMVPASALLIAQADAPAAAIAPDLEKAGVVLVRGNRRYGAVEADDVVAQLRAWAGADAAAMAAAHRSRS
ncbi:MAG: hypothetical protein ACYDAN_16190 [Candidatus Limnocylindrales bacterium]